MQNLKLRLRQFHIQERLLTYTYNLKKHFLEEHINNLINLIPKSINLPDNQNNYSIIKQLKEKLYKQKYTITKPDKSNCLILMPINQSKYI